MEKEADELKWNFTEMLKALIALSLPADRQVESYGEGGIGEEMAIDFNANYSENVEDFLEGEFLTEDEADALDKIIAFCAARSGAEFSDFWLDETLLPTHPDWQEMRELAKAALVALEMDHLDLSTTIANDTTIDDDGEEQLTQMIFTEIIEKGTELDESVEE